MIENNAFEVLKVINTYGVDNCSWSMYENKHLSIFYAQDYLDKHEELCSEVLDGRWLALYLDDSIPTEKCPAPDRVLIDEDNVERIWFFKM